jgi:hypothetical protein
MPPIAPRPFTQLARRCWRLRIEVPRGYLSGVSAPPWYRRMRRSPAQRDRSELAFLSARRVMAAKCARMGWHRTMPGWWTDPVTGVSTHIYRHADVADEPVGVLCGRVA